VLSTPMDKTLNDVEGHGDKKDGDDACGQHPPEDGKAEQHPTMRAGSSRHDQRQDAENEGERRHQDGPEPQLCSG
jgi:hypothetical protein